MRNLRELLEGCQQIARKIFLKISPTAYCSTRYAEQPIAEQYATHVAAPSATSSSP